MTRKEHKTTPKAIWQTLYTDSAAVPLESPAWFDWLDHNALFEMEAPDGTFTARRELRGGAAFWYAFVGTGASCIRPTWAGRPI